eukprot:CAMPEP_0174264070 /NCGR_PEP_ID=MMETSP0439-20130205/21218_1 /TAXON_ID=0 /ORGANISM="Stereomyxa ramosa, Strain Chinc5" /LENGTH=67 /DNA_ID=CAMNT_0015349781 /DNA_START=1 /DNA_END=201 /DNA_ORIENTATION=-
MFVIDNSLAITSVDNSTVRTLNLTQLIGYYLYYDSSSQKLWSTTSDSTNLYLVEMDIYTGSISNHRI